jgi:hypothetical protein
MEWNRMEWNGIEWNGMEENGMELNEILWNKMEYNLIEWKRIELEWNGITLKSALCCRISSILVWTNSEHCLSSKRKVEIKMLNLSPLSYKNDNFEETPLCYRKLQNGIC